MTTYLNLTAHGLIEYTRESFIIPENVKIVSFAVPGKQSNVLREKLFLFNSIKYGTSFLKLLTATLEVFGLKFIDLYSSPMHGEAYLKRSLEIYYTNIVIKPDLIPLINNRQLIDSVFETINYTGKTKMYYYDPNSIISVTSTTEKIQNMRLNVPGTLIEDRLLGRSANEYYIMSELGVNEIFKNLTLPPIHIDRSLLLVNNLARNIMIQSINGDAFIQKKLGLFEITDNFRVLNNTDTNGNVLSTTNIVGDFTYNQNVSNLLDNPLSYSVFMKKRHCPKSRTDIQATITHGHYLKDLIIELKRLYPHNEIILFLDTCRVSDVLTQDIIGDELTGQVTSYLRQLNRNTHPISKAQSPVRRIPRLPEGKSQYQRIQGISAITHLMKSPKKTSKPNKLKKSIKKSKKKNTK